LNFQEGNLSGKQKTFWNTENFSKEYKMSDDILDKDEELSQQMKILREGLKNVHHCGNLKRFSCTIIL